MPLPGYNLARFDFVSIRLAVLCAQTGSLTTAARQCNLVLPAASRRLKDARAAGEPGAPADDVTTARRAA